MEDPRNEPGLIELGIASTDTQGQVIGNSPEPGGYYFKVLLVD